MDHLADSIAKLSQGRENWYIGRKVISVDDSSGGKCEPVIVFECMDLSIGQRLNVSGLSCVSNKVLRCSDSYFFRRGTKRQIHRFLVMVPSLYVSMLIYLQSFH